MLLPAFRHTEKVGKPPDTGADGVWTYTLGNAALPLTQYSQQLQGGVTTVVSHKEESESQRLRDLSKNLGAGLNDTKVSTLFSSQHFPKYVLRNKLSSRSDFKKATPSKQNRKHLQIPSAEAWGGHLKLFFHQYL